MGWIKLESSFKAYFNSFAKEQSRKLKWIFFQDILNFVPVNFLGSKFMNICSQTGYSGEKKFLHRGTGSTACSCKKKIDDEYSDGLHLILFIYSHLPHCTANVQFHSVFSVESLCTCLSLDWWSYSRAGFGDILFWVLESKFAHVLPCPVKIASLVLVITSVVVITPGILAF